MSDRQVIAGRYEIVRTIGQGGMGDVFRGLDRQTGEAVAIKLLKPDILDADPNLVERFEREGEALRQLDHPNIVNMLAAVEEDGLHYLVMEYVGGGSLRDLLDAEPQLPVNRVLEIALDLADALTRAHRLQIIHRDIKPANVLLADDGTPRLTDFGVARMGKRTRMTATGSLIGTYAYLSPEACRGQAFDARTDIWSFGVMLFEMLAGKVPFDAEHPGAVLVAIMQNPLPNLRALRSDAPAALVALIERMLEKDPDQRLRSVRQVGAELEAILYELDTPLITPSQPAPKVGRFATPTPAGDESLAVRITPPTEPVIVITDDPVSMPAPAAGVAAPRRRWLWIGVAAVVAILAAIALLAALGVFSGEDGGGEDAPLAVEPVGPGEYMVLVAGLEPLGGVEERDVARFVVDDLTRRLEDEVPRSKLRVRAYPGVIRSAAGARSVAESAGATVVVWGNYTPDFIELHIALGVTSGFRYIQFPRDMLEQVANQRVRIEDERRESVALPVLGVFNVLFTADGNAYQVSRLLAIVDDLDTVNATALDDTPARHLYDGSQLYFADGPASIEAYGRAIEKDRSNPISYPYRGLAYLRQGDTARGERDMDTAARLATALGITSWTSPAYARAIYQSTLGDLTGALSLCDQIVAARPDDWFGYTYRAALHYLLGDDVAAEADLRAAFELGPDANFPYILMGLLALRDGRIGEMRAMFETVLAEYPDPALGNRTIEASMGSANPNVFGPLLSAAGNLVIGQYEDVLRDTAAALAVDDTLAEVYLLQGVAYCNLDQHAEAEAAYSQGIERDPAFAVLYLLRAEARLAQADVAGSAQDLVQAQSAELGPEFAALVQAGIAGEVTCKNFFMFDPATYQAPAATPGN